MPNKIRLVVHGAAGRMGQSVLRIALERDDCEVCAALAPSQSTLIGEPLSQVYGKGAPDIEFTSQLDPDLLPDALIERLRQVGRHVEAERCALELAALPKH